MDRAAMLILSALLSLCNVAFGDGREIDDLRREFSQLRVEFERQAAELKALKDAPRVTGGSSYVRWGRTTCEGSSTVVYKGYAAGPHWAANGGGSNYLCLHERPQWKRHVPGFATWSGIIYGVEYEFFNAGHGLYNNEMFTFGNNDGHSVLDHPAPCAVCNTPYRISSVMIPARTDCPLGWTKEYNGYIISYANIADKYRTTYICWDEEPEIAVGGTHQNQALIYPVQVGCGSLPCSRFKNGWELTCVVCSK